MKTLLKRLAVSAVRRSVNCLMCIPEIITVDLCQRHKKAKITEFDTTPRENYAIVAIYPTEGLSIFLKNLLEAFKQNQVGIILVSNLPLSKADHDFVALYASVLIERSNIGRDFGAYQAGLKYFDSIVGKSPYKKLFLVNDTLFYSKYTGQLVARMIENEEPFLGAFENFSHHYHAGSFFLCFERQVVQSEAFSTFWRRYRPYSTRFHCIISGEVRLTMTLMKAGWSPSIIYSTTAMRDAITRFAEAGPDSLAALVTSWIPESWSGGGFPETNTITPESRPGSRLLDAFLRKAEKCNQSHALALCANTVMGAPFVKKDICYRDYWSISSAVHLPQGFDSEERGEMLKTLRRKGIPESFSAMGRVRLLLDL